MVVSMTAILLFLFGSGMLTRASTRNLPLVRFLGIL